MSKALFNPQRELDALAAVKAAIAAEIEADPDFLIEAAESETNILETIDALANADLVDESLVDGIEAAERALADRKARFKRRRGVRRAVIEQALLLLDVEKLERPAATLSIAKRAPAAEVDDEALIPSRFFKSKPTLDKAALADALKAGETVPGAHLSNARLSLTIRRR